MTTYLIRRLLQGLLIIILVTIMIFLVMRLLPSDPLSLYMSSTDMAGYTEQDLMELKHQYGLDKSLPMQYIDWMKGILHGDFGKSILFNDNVGSIISQRLPITVHLGLLSFVYSGIFGIFFGVICALRRGTFIDTFFTLLANLGITLPSFWIGILLIYVFSIKLNLLPVYGYTSPFTDFWLNARQVIMPVLCLSFMSLASLTRQTRSSMLEVVHQDYIRTAWSKGLTERTIIMRHTLKNALIPVITVMGMQVGLIFGGSVLIENVFSIPGMGRMMTEAIFGQDYQVVQGGILIIALVVVISNLIVDISYGWLDPRIRYD
jgi:peptide/nickel transport system permease protein